MGETTQLLTPDRPEWDEWLGRAPHDFYHLAAYHAFAESVGEGRAHLLVHGDPDRFLAWPYLVRPLDGDGGHADATSVYGYSGPVGRGLESEAFRASAWSAFRAAWADQRLVTMFTRFHPLLGNERFCRGFHGAEAPTGGEVLQFGRSVSIDLSLGVEERRAGYPQPLRQEIKRAERSGLSVDLDPEWRHFPSFVEFYRATMERNDAAERYLFSDRYLDGLREVLRGVAHLAVAHVEGEPAAALLFTVYRGMAAAHLTGVGGAFTQLSPLKCLIDRSCDLARDLGAERLHLGAGRGGAEDSLFDFKSRFSPVRHGFAVGRWILDREANDRLAGASASGAGLGETFFPAYRAPARARETQP